MVKKSRPFFTSRRPNEGIEGVLPNKGCGLPSPNQSPSIVQLYKALGGGWDMDRSSRATAVISPPDAKR